MEEESDLRRALEKEGQAHLLSWRRWSDPTSSIAMPMQKGPQQHEQGHKHHPSSHLSHNPSPDFAPPLSLLPLPSSVLQETSIPTKQESLRITDPVLFLYSPQSETLCKSELTWWRCRFKEERFQFWRRMWTASAEKMQPANVVKFSRFDLLFAIFMKLFFLFSQEYRYPYNLLRYSCFLWECRQLKYCYVFLWHLVGGEIRNKSSSWTSIPQKFIIYKETIVAYGYCLLCHFQLSCVTLTCSQSYQNFKGVMTMFEFVVIFLS